MSIKIETIGNATIYRLTGELDTLCVQRIRAQAEKAILEAKGPNIVDGHELTHIDSSGIGFLVYLFKKSRTGGQPYAIAGLMGQPQDMIQFLKIDKMVPCYPSLDEAQKAF